MEMMVKIEEPLRKKGIMVETGVLVGVHVSPSDRELLKELFGRAAEKVMGGGQEITSHPHVRALREFYWRMGIDPTKRRPSSEALLRRVLRGSYPAVNNLVDAGNVASVETLVPIGIYDADRLSPPLILTTARGGEVFSPIGGEDIRLDEGVVVLKDRDGVVHLFPHRDSVRTMVRESTERALVISCGVSGIDERDLKRAVELTVHYAGVLGALPHPPSGKT